VRVRVAYVEEPPFYWTDDSGSPTGADVELAQAVFAAIGATAVDFHATTFEELLPGVQSDRWDVNVPIFVTPERAQIVAFSTPVWSLSDGFVVHRSNPKGLTSYAVVAGRDDARLGLIPGQVQFDAAQAAGVGDGQIVTFADQPAAVAALLAGEIDAFAATAVGNRVIAETHPEVDAVALPTGANAPVGAFSFNRSNRSLREAVDEQLREYLGSDDHRARMAKYGITGTEIDPVI
jgi:polar amino acid transport system substrate-binding protein